MLLQNKVVIVTGAGGGLGEGIARVCHREGASVAIADIRGDAASQVAKTLGERALGLYADVSKDTDLERLVVETLNAFGRIDGLVNNAGVNFAKPFFETTPEDWTRVISVDLRGAYFLTQMVCRQMLRQTPAGGSIVNISSVHSCAALPGAGPYDAAKWGMVGFTKSVAVELAAQGIRANAISPGLINTQIWRDLLAAAADRDRCWGHWKSNIPIERTIEPEEIGELAVFLLSGRSSSITGANILADGGMTSLLVSKADYEVKAIEGK